MSSDNGQTTADGFDFGADFNGKYANELRLIGRFNLAIFGRTGAGKSTLINSIFGPGTAMTGTGKPVTMETTYYPHPSGVLGVYDCRGFETGQSGDEILEQLSSEVRALREKPLSEQIHVAWYVVSASDRRFEDSQAGFVRRLREMGLPVILVMTQVPEVNGRPHPSAAEFAKSIQADVRDAIFGGHVVLVQAMEDEYLGQKVHGLKQLLEATFQAAPEGAQEALNAAQKIDLKKKRDACKAIIATGAASAAAVGAVPIPFSDAVLLVPIQVTMMAGIALRFGLPVDSDTLGALAKASLLAGGVTTWIGRGLANLARMIPGIGTIGGGVIIAGIASTLTTAVGMAWIAVCERLVTMDPRELKNLLNNSKAITDIFMSTYKAQITR